MITEDQFRKLKRDVEEAKTEADRAEGALTQLLQRLKEEFNCETVKEARALLLTLNAKADKAQKDFEKAMRDYEGKWQS